MREKVVEQGLVRAVRRFGGLALKFASPGFNGVPDRLLLFDGGKVAFAEGKAPGQRPRPLQLHRMDQLRKQGFQVYVIDDMNQISQIVDEISEGGLEGEPLMTASGGNIVRGEGSKRRENCPVDSFQWRTGDEPWTNRNKQAPQCGVATIEVAGDRKALREAQ